MKVKLNLNIFLFIIIFFITKQIWIYSLVMIFALIHEISHLICGVLLGFKPDNFKIMPIGFCIEFKTNIEDYNFKILKSNKLSFKKILIALAGPIVNLSISIIGNIMNLNSNIVYANFLIFIFNMIPIYPLDGGKIIKNILKILLGNRKAYKYTNRISNIIVIVLTMICSILILYINNISILFILLALWGLIIKENRKYYTYNKIYETIDKSNNYL